MRKSSKILAVVIAVALLCAAIATMVSATVGEIIYPEYTAPSAASRLWNVDFNNGKTSGSFNASNGMALNVVDNGSGNYYGNVTNWVDGEMAEHINYIGDDGKRVGGNTYGNTGSPYTHIVNGSYFVWSFDIMADKYATQYDFEGETINELITIEDYNALDEEDKALYWPSFTETAFYIEAPSVFGYPYLYIIKSADRWYFTDSTKKQTFALPTEAGVWTNIQLVMKTDINVRYTFKGAENIVSFVEYKDADKTDHENATVILSTQIAWYANGEYQFDDNAIEVTNKEYAYSTFTSGDNGKFKYAQMKAGKDSSSKVKTPMSICYDNVSGWSYPVGYEGDFATAFENRASLLNTNDAIFNQNYNLTNSLAATVTTADGTYGYGSVEQAYSAAVNGATVEILAANNATLNVSTGIESLTVKTNGKNFKYTLPEGYPYECNEISAGVYEIVKGKYAAPVYVGPVNATLGVNKEFATGIDGFYSEKGIISINNPSIGGNGYLQASLNGTTASGDIIRTGNLGAGGYVYGLLTSDIFTVEFDYMADKYRNLTDKSLITIEAYEALSETDKASYEPAYHNQYFYIEFDNVIAYDYANAPRISKTGDRWYVYIDSQTFVPLPEKAGVWSHFSFVYSFGNTVTYYTDDTKTATATMSYADYKRSGKGADYFVSINTADTTLSLYVDGEFCAQKTVGKAMTDFTKLDSANARYLQVRGTHNSSSSNYNTNFSIGFDNLKSFRFAEGYNGAYATAVANKASILNCEDAPFNKTYNKLNAIAGVVAEGADLGYYVYNHNTINANLTEKCTLELFGSVPKIDVVGIRQLTVISNGYDFKVTDGYIVTELEDGTYLVKAPDYLVPEYVGPVSITTLGKTDFESPSTQAAATGFSATSVEVNKVLTPQAALNVIKNNATGNSYAQITNIVDGKMIGGNSRQYGGLHAKYFEVAYGDYFTFSFDIMADKYTDGTNLITPEQYNALSDEDKANYSLSYATTYYYAEMPYLTAAIKSLFLKNFDGKWYICTDLANKNNLDTQAGVLSGEAGVWNNVTMAFKIDANVRYTENGVTNTVSYAVYKAISDKSAHTDATMVMSSDYAVYVNGEYAFDYAASDANGKEMAYASFEAKNDRTFRYMQMQAGTSSSSRLTTPTSICYDNIRCDRYPDGYNGEFATIFASRSDLHNVADAVYNSTYAGLSGRYTAAVYSDTVTGNAYFSHASAFANVKNGDTVELFANMTVPETPLAEVFYIKTNGYKHLLLLPDGYTSYETETKGTYVVKVAGPEDMVDVEWIVDGEVYATTKEYIGATADLEYALTKVHPWVSQYVESWADAEGNNIVKAGGKNTFTAVLGYEATPEIMMNITTTQALVTNVYIPALTDEELAEISGVYFAQGKKAVPEDASGNKFGSRANVTINGKTYYKFSETMRIIYQEENRSAVLSFSYKGVELSLTFLCESRAYFNTVLSSNNFSTVEKELIYSALVYADNVTRYSASGEGYSALVAEYAQYKSGSTLAEIIASAKKENIKSDLITGYSISVKDGYAARLMLTLNKDVAGADFTKDSAKLSYKDVRNNPKTAGFDSYADGTLLSSYGNKIYDMRQTFDIIVGEEVVGTFNLAAYIADLAKKGYAEDSTEMQIALSIYHYSECSEAYKRS